MLSRVGFGLVLIAIFMVGGSWIRSAAANGNTSMKGGSLASPASSQTKGGQKSKGKQDAQEESLNLSATLVQVPTVVTERGGKFVSDLTQSDFTLMEDGKRQDIGLFQAVKQPFSVVIVIDTSNSAEDRLKAMQNSAIEFVQQLGPEDRAMLITFDNEIHELSDFTSDHSELESAIKGVEAGFGKLLYEAVNRALEKLKEVEGRRAVILFTDGVDLDSIEASAESTARQAEQVGAAIYTVKFETRWWIESQALKQIAEMNKRPDRPYGAEGRIPLPSGGPSPTGMPNPGSPKIQVETSGIPTISIKEERPTAESTKENLDKMYGKADAYLAGLSDHTGGRLFSSQTLTDTRTAFASIAEELRNQYLIGYYTSAKRADDKYHKIKVETTKKGLTVRSRQGFRFEKDAQRDLWH
jgi:VWFA-related protein